MVSYATPAGEVMEGPGISPCQSGGFMLTFDLSRSGDAGESLLGEVGIESENRLNASSPHDFEAYTVHETQISLGCRKKSTHPGPVYGVRNPFHTYNRQYILLKGSDRCNAQAMLYESKTFDKDIIRCNGDILIGQESDPGVSCVFMVCVVSIKEAIKG
jgi:hypothetical protein